MLGNRPEEVRADIWRSGMQGMACAKALRQDLGVLGTVKKPARLEPREGDTGKQRAGEVGRGVGEEPCYGTVQPPC